MMLYELAKWEKPPAQLRFSHDFFICCHGLCPAEVWSMPWWASKTKEIWTKKKEISVRKTQKNEWRHQLFLSPCVIPISSLGFQQSDLGQNKKTNLSENVNVKVLRLLLSGGWTKFWKMEVKQTEEAAGVCVAFDPIYDLLIWRAGVFPCCSYWSSHSTHCESPNTFRGWKTK